MALRHSLGLGDCVDEVPSVLRPSLGLSECSDDTSSEPSLSLELDCFGAVAARARAAANRQPGALPNAPSGKPPGAGNASSGWASLATTRAQASLSVAALPLPEGAQPALPCRSREDVPFCMCSSIIRSPCRVSGSGPNERSDRTSLA